MKNLNECLSEFIRLLNKLATAIDWIDEYTDEYIFAGKSLQGTIDMIADDLERLDKEIYWLDRDDIRYYSINGICRNISRLDACEIERSRTDAIAILNNDIDEIKCVYGIK